MSEDMRRIVEEGWQDKEKGDPKELLKSSVFELRRRIDAASHMFQERDGTPREPNEHWIKNHGSAEAAAAVIKKDFLDPFQKQKEILHDALIYVENEILPAEDVDIKYLNQVGGALNFVAYKVLDRVADTVESTDELKSLLHNFTGLFFHVSGWEHFQEKARRRLGAKK